MTVRFLIDEDLDPAIVKGLRLRAPAVNVLDVKLDQLRGSKDHLLLELAYAQGRVLVTGRPKYNAATFCRPACVGPGFCRSVHSGYNCRNR